MRNRSCKPCAPPPGTSARPGRTRRVEFEYRRGGTLAYFAAYDVHRARVLGQIAPQSSRRRRPGT